MKRRRGGSAPSAPVYRRKSSSSEAPPPDTSPAQRNTNPTQSSADAPSPDPSPAQRNSTPTEAPQHTPIKRMTSPAMLQEPQPGSAYLRFGSVEPESDSTRVQSESSPTTLQEPQPGSAYLRFGSFEPEADSTRVQSETSPTTAQHTRSAASEKESSARGNSSSSRSPGQPKLLETSLARQDSPTQTRQGIKMTEMSRDASSARGNSSSRSPSQLYPLGITTASLPSRSSDKTPPLPKGPSSALRYSPTPTTQDARLARGDSVSPAQQKPEPCPPRCGSKGVISSHSSTNPSPLDSGEKTKSDRAGGYKLRSRHVAPPPPGQPAASPPPPERIQSSPLDSGDKTKSGSSSADKVAGRYNLRSRHVAPPPPGQPAATPTPVHPSPPPPEQPAATPVHPSTPPSSRQRSSLTINDDQRTKQLYRQYLENHEKPNTVMALLTQKIGEPLKLVIDFRKLLKSNRALAHTICNDKERIWNSLLEVSRSFLSQQTKAFNIRAHIEGVSDEMIQNNLIELELVFRNLPSNIFTLVDFLNSTTLTTFEEILEGHKILVPTDEGRRILHSVVAYLVALHKEGKYLGGNWRVEDWDVEDSRKVSFSKAPIEFTDPRQPANDLARLDSQVVRKFCKRDHLNIPPGQRLHLLYAASFRNDLRDRSGLTTDDYHELICSHPFLMPSEARADLLFALYRFYRTWRWDINMDFDSVFKDMGLSDWTRKIKYGNSKVLKKIFWFGWNRAMSGCPYNPCLGHQLVFGRHSLEHIRDHEQLIRKMIELELLVSSRFQWFLSRVLRLMFQHGKVTGEVKTRWDMYVGSGVNERL